jgi:hypothetical protein
MKISNRTIREMAAAAGMGAAAILPAGCSEAEQAGPRTTEPPAQVEKATAEPQQGEPAPLPGEPAPLPAKGHGPDDPCPPCGMG